MNGKQQNRITRRVALLGGASAAALAAVAIRADSASAAPTIQSGGGAAGGGSVALGKETAQFSLFASRFAAAGESDPLIFGQIQWKDSAGFGFKSTKITSYGPIEGDDDNARALEGEVKLNSGEKHPFRLRLVDSSGPGGKGDDLELAIGPADALVYEVKGALVTGDIELLTFEFPD